MMNWLAENGTSISRASIIVCLTFVGFQTYRLFLWMRTEFEALRDQIQRISFSHTKTEPEHETIAVRVVPESEYHVLKSQAGIAEEMNHPRFLMKVPKESDFFRKPCVHDPDRLPNGQSRQRSHLEPSRREFQPHGKTTCEGCRTQQCSGCKNHSVEDCAHCSRRFYNQGYSRRKQTQKGGGL